MSICPSGREWLSARVTEKDLAAIRSHIQQERALGSPLFQAIVARTLNRSVVVRTRGRPRKVFDGLRESMISGIDSNE